jgi:hypothetical protein
VKSVAEEPDSPRRRQAISTTASGQRQIQEEIEPLKGKIAESLQPPTAQGASASTNPSTDDKTRQAMELLTKLADQAGEAMLAAADDLDESSLDEAIPDQNKVLELLDQIYMGVVPFPALLERAISTEQQLIDQVAPAVNQPGEEQPGEETDREKTEDDVEPIELDHDEVAWNQEFVSGWARVMGPKAAQNLKQLEEMGDAALGAQAGPSNAQQPGTDPAAAKEQLEGLKQSMQKAVELAPKVEERSSEAAEKLRAEKPAAALPNQEQALELLKEIAEPLPKQEQNQQDQQQNQDQQKEREQDQQSGQDQKQQEERQRDLSRQQAEAVLRKVRERQRERRDLEKQLQQYLARPGQVDKDW